MMGIVFLRKNQKIVPDDDDTLFTDWLTGKMPMWMRQLPIMQTLVNIAYFRQREMKKAKINKIVENYEDATKDVEEEWNIRIQQHQKFDIEKWEKTNKKVRKSCKEYKEVQEEMDELRRQQLEMGLVNAFGTAVPSFLLDLFVFLFNGKLIGIEASYKEGYSIIQEMALLPRFIQCLQISMHAYNFLSKHKNSTITGIQVQLCFLLVTITRITTLALMLAYLKLWSLLLIGIYFTVAHYKLRMYYTEDKFWAPFGILASVAMPSVDLGRHCKYFWETNDIVNKFHIIQLSVLLLVVNVFELVRIYGGIDFNYFHFTNVYGNATKPPVLQCLYPANMTLPTNTRLSNCIWNNGNVTCPSLDEISSDNKTEETEFVTVCPENVKDLPFLSQWILFVAVLLLVLSHCYNYLMLHYLRNLQYFHLFNWKLSSSCACCACCAGCACCMNWEWKSNYQKELEHLELFDEHLNNASKEQLLFTLFQETNDRFLKDTKTSFLEWLFKTGETHYAQKVLERIPNIPITPEIWTAVSSNKSIDLIQFVQKYVESEQSDLLHTPQTEDELIYAEEGTALTSLKAGLCKEKENMNDVDNDVKWIEQLFNSKNYHILFAMEENKRLGKYYRELQQRIKSKTFLIFGPKLEI